MSNRNQQAPERIMALVDPIDLAGATILIPIADIPSADIGAWQPYSLCAQADPESWFPEKGGSTREAKKICLDCPVRPQCLQYALDNDERFGVWGGLSERDRRKLRKKKTQPGQVTAASPDDDCDGEESDRPVVTAVTAA